MNNVNSNLETLSSIISSDSSLSALLGIITDMDLEIETVTRP